MEIETLKKNHLARNIIIGILVIALITTLILNFTRAKYRITESFPLINGTITFNRQDLIIQAYYNDELLDTFPNQNDGLNVESITCNNNATATFNEDTWELSVDNLVTRGTICNLYFDDLKAQKTILADKDIQTRTDFSTIFTANTNGTIYQAPDGEGTSYYFAGKTTENWLQFAGFYWRIIRINGDGTIRIIYNGTSANTTGSNTQLSSTSVFNSSYTNNMYVGYMYTQNQVHGLGTSSTIKEVVDTWYQTNIANNIDYTSKISPTTGFCGDRSLYSGTGTGTTETYYGAYMRLVTNKNPTYDCANDSDLYTVSGAGVGNEALTYPVGVITMDEAVYAGHVIGIGNTEYYLHTNYNYWTMSPLAFDGVETFVFFVGLGDWFVDARVNTPRGVRPVINLKANITLTGDGTASNPFKVEGAI